MSSGLPRSVQTRLVNHAKKIGVDPNLVLVRYATERLLYRLSQSPYADRFVLKGALLMLMWLGEMIRPTRDADLLGFGDFSTESLAEIFADVSATKVEPDGLEFDATSIRVAPIRPEDNYGGFRTTLTARLGPARLAVQVDIGIGDAVVPEPEWTEYPTLLDMPRPRLRVYRQETALAEKVQAMVILGTKNSRMRDFFDVYLLATRESFDGPTLFNSFHATFARRKTDIPSALPVALTAAFADIDGKQAQWKGFLARNRLTSVPEKLSTVIALISDFVTPVFTALLGEHKLEKQWTPDEGWRLDESAVRNNASQDVRRGGFNDRR